jgi:TPR repeat protein/AcrR family transcriptional regulator
MAAANPNRGRPSDREATRNAIIDAARRVAARDGMAEVSLSRVAAEADFAPGVVYGHFRSKNELLLSVVANDLTAMASEMRETGWPEDHAESEVQPALPLEEPIALPNSIAEVPAEMEPARKEHAEPFAGNAGLSAVARALSAADEEEITHIAEAEAEAEAETVLPEDDVEAFDADETVAEIADEPTPINEPAVEQTAPVVEEAVERVLPEDDLEVFSNEYVQANSFAPPAAPMISNAIIEDTPAPVAKVGFDAVFPEDDLDPFGNDAAPAHVFGRRHTDHVDVPVVENKKPVAEQKIEETVVAPETVEQQPTEEPIFGHMEIVEPVEAAPVEEPAPALVEDPVLEAIDKDDENRGPDLAIQNMPAVQKKRQERTQLNDIINRLVMPDAPSAIGTTGAISRLDRRMSVFEKALADMEVRYGAIERDNDEAITAVADSVKTLTSRVEAGEKRALEITAELRGGVLDAATRLAAVEAIMASTKMGAGSTPAPRHDAPLPPDVLPPEIAFTPTPLAKPEPRFSEPKSNGNDFLSAARRSAAAAVPVEPIEEEKTGANRMRYLLGGGSVLVLVLAVGGYFISEHSNQVKHNSVAHVRHVVARVAVAAPKVAMPSASATQTPAPAAQIPAQTVQASPAPAPVAPAAVNAPVAVPAPEAVKAPRASHKHKAHAAPKHIATAHVAAVHVSPVQAPVQPAQTETAPLDHLTALARAGNAQAQTIVGLQYVDNGDDAASKTAAAHWLREAAQKGEPIAQYRLGTLYQRGSGVPADTIEAMHWYEAAAKQGNVKAMYNLGLAYVQTAGAPKDYAQAAHWFTLAANLGFVDAQFNLAVLYERGAGVTQSLVDAYKWYAIAAAQGDGVSRERIAALGTQLNADDLAQAQHAAQAFKPSTPDRAVNIAPEMSDLN